MALFKASYSRKGMVTKCLLLLFSLLYLSACSWFPSAQEPGYQFVSSWGVKGSQPGQFHDPTGIALSKNEIFISDSRNSRIQVFDFEGHFKRQFGQKGEGIGQLGRPMNLTIRNNELYVADYWNDRIQVFSLEGNPLRSIGHSGEGPGEFNAPGGVAVAENGDLYVADFYSHRVQHLQANGEFIDQWGQTGEIGIWAGEFNYPTDVALAPNGKLYVADGYNDRVQVFDQNSFLTKWGGPFAINIFGPFKGWFATVTSIHFDAKGNVLVADFYNHRIQKFTPDGEFLTSFGEEGEGLGQFNHAIAAAATEDGVIFALDFGNNRVQKWRKIQK